MSSVNDDQTCRSCGTINSYKNKKCSNCGNDLRSQRSQTTSSLVTDGTASHPVLSGKVWNRRKFGISQRHRRQLTGQEAYHIKDPETNQKILWAKRGRFSFRGKTDITVFISENTDETNRVLIIKDEAFFDIFGKFTVIDAKTGEVLALFNRHFLRSLIREKWTIRNPETREELVTIQARSWIISVIRNVRFLFGALDFFIQFIRLQFDFVDKTGNRIGFFDRKFTIGDNYIVDLTEDVNNLIDSRVGVAAALILDSAESR